MVALVQRVDEASVYIDDRLHSAIQTGLLVFLGVKKGDSEKDADYLLEKILNLRIFEDRQGKMNLSVKDLGGGLLVVSQFTLLADCRKGRRPSFTDAEDPERAKHLYEYFLSRGRGLYDRILSGEFQAMMKVRLVNNGPVTLSINSRT
ncbi:MAG: D-aminoacyl-tRNA deacylase [Syntrophales bacterium]|jgi:D-tyrosyl-tRNA(Tyr) deacylase|nr:D-aminoacyl-tRNA deacylase [Syntrophales bacterium]